MDPRLLADAGGWAVVIAMGSAFAVGFQRGWFVPGFVYRREVERGDLADVQATRTADALAKLVTLLDLPRDER